MIELREIQKHFTLGGGKLEVIRGIDLSIKAGEFVTIMGKSGSGKSTLLNIIACLDRPSAGQYKLFGKEVSCLSDTALSQLRNRHIGFVFQSFNLIARNTALKNVEKPLVYQGLNASERRRKALDMLEKVGLSERSGHSPSQLSGGQQQRVAVARALVTNPGLLIADEPTGNLDSTTSREVMDLLQSICKEGTTVVMVTHDPSLAKYSDRVVELCDGKVLKA